MDNAYSVDLIEKYMFIVFFLITYKTSYNLSTELLLNRPLNWQEKKTFSGNFFTNIVNGFEKFQICLKHVLKYANNLISYKVNFHV